MVKYDGIGQLNACLVCCWRKKIGTQTAQVKKFKYESYITQKQQNSQESIKWEP